MIHIDVDKSNKCNGEYSLYISFPYDKDIVDTIRQEPIRYWNPETKKWEVPVKRYDELAYKLSDYDISITDSNEILSKLSSNRRPM